MIAIPKQSDQLSHNVSAESKENDLRILMRGMGSVLVAYSGGVDSTYLALIAKLELGKAAYSVLGISPSVSEYQQREAKDAAERAGLNFRTMVTDEVSDPNYAANPANRCYFCKTELYEKLRSFALRENIEFVVDGTNSDDLGGHRPGNVAAAEKGVRSPLAELGFTKEDIRQRSLVHGIKGWDKPASPCLSSRIAYGVPVTIDRLSKVERGENFLRRTGFREFRVRVHDELARIEISPAEFDLALNGDVTAAIADEFKRIGFTYVTLDLNGFRSGAMNEALSKHIN